MQRSIGRRDGGGSQRSVVCEIMESNHEKTAVESALNYENGKGMERTKMKYIKMIRTE